jgi:type VI secretion system secreted protein VgrG
MTNGFTQAGQFLRVTTPFGGDVLRLVQFSGREAISEPFLFHLTMQADDANLDPTQIVGAPVTVCLSPDTTPTRNFNGIVTRFLHAGGYGDQAIYLADLAPRLWLLTLGTDRLVYQNLSVPDIVKQLLTAANVVFEDKLTDTYTARDYCVCFDETPFAFISRLMEEEGIYYFFTFSDTGHTMVLADNASAHATLAGAETVTFAPENIPVPAILHVSQFDLVCKIVVQQHTINDYNYTMSATALLAETKGTSGRGAHYVYPGRHTAAASGSRLAQIHTDAQQADSTIAQGTGRCHPMVAGGRFTLQGHPRNTLNGAHILRSVTHHATDGMYSNAFDTFAATVPFRAPLQTPRPRVAGMHTAVVVGPAGEEIWSDKLGRVKVQFHWDRFGKHNETSSCWVRVAQTSAGQGWGHLFLPRIGQEVLISYIDGDPDRPLITGSVYNDAQTTPVVLPGAQTQSVIRTRSSKNGAAGNEIRLEDKLDAEQFFVHAQKDMQVDIENDLATTLIAGNETRTVKKGNRSTTIETGNDTLNVKGTRDVTVTGAETRTNEANLDHTVKGNLTLTVSGNLVIDVSGSITLKSGTAFSAKAGTALSAEAGTSLTNKAGTSISQQGLTIESKASASQTVEGGGMLTLKGGLVSIN